MSQFYPEDKWIVANDLNIHYLDWGGDKTKKPLILMHGIGGHAHPVSYTHLTLPTKA